MNHAAPRSRANRKSNFFYSFLFLPRERRESILTLYDFCRRTDDIIDKPGSVEEKTAKLQEWKEQLARSLNGNLTNPSFANLTAVALKFNIPRPLFLELVDGVAMDLTKHRYNTLDELLLYCYRVGSTVGLMSIEIFGYRNPGAKIYAENLGIALQLTNILRDLKVDVMDGRIYLPLKDLEEYQYTEKELLRGEVNSRFENLIHFESERARSYFRRAKEVLQREDLKTLYPAEAMGRIYEKLLDKIERCPSDIFRKKIRVSTFSKLCIVLSTWLTNKPKLFHAA